MCSWVNVAKSVLLNGGDANLVAEQISNVVDAVVDHGGSLQAESPGDNAHIFWQAHRPQHFWPENS